MNRLFKIFLRYLVPGFVCFLLRQIILTAQTQPPDSLFPSALVNGNFEQDADQNQKPDGWESGGDIKLISGKEGRWAVRLKSLIQSSGTSLTQRLTIPREVPVAVALAGLVKGNSIQVGEGNREGGGKITAFFFDDRGRPVDKPRDFSKWQMWEGDFGWRPWSWRVSIPTEAKEMELRFELAEAEGEIIFDDLQLIWGFPDDFDRGNFVVDGGFEFFDSYSSWSLDKKGSQVRFPGFQGRACLFLENKRGNRPFASQKIVFEEGRKSNKSLFEFMASLEGRLKVTVDFFNRTGQKIASEVIGSWEKKEKGWRRFEKFVTLPDAAVQADLRFEIDSKTGKVSVDAVRWVFPEGGTRPLHSQNDTAGWKPFIPFSGPLKGALDASSLLEAPAGRHGFLRTAGDGHFYFEDGSRAHFLGINLQAPQALPTHKEAEQFAERLAQYGFNLVRLHHMDAPWPKPNIFDPNREDTQHLSAESLDRLDYFIDQLKKRGIYIYLDLLVSRKFRKRDGVPAYGNLSRGAKMAAQYNRRLIELQKRYAEQLLTHQNPYTGKKLVDDPVLALTGIVNESSLDFSGKKAILELPRFYREELGKLWVDHLKAQGDLRAEEKAELYLEPDRPEVRRFYEQLQRNYFSEMQAFLQGMGVKIPISGSNLAKSGWDLATNAELDFVDRHAYWDHPMGGYGDLVRFHNNSLLKEVIPRYLAAEPKRINPILKLSPLHVEGKPFVVGEWNFHWPNEFRATGVFLMAAYALLQDWDGILQFNFEGHLEPEKIQGNFDVSSKSEIFLQFPAASRFFYQRHVRPAAKVSKIPLSETGDKFYPEALTHRLQRSSAQNESQGKTDPQDGIYESDTGELVWNEKEGSLLIRTPYTQAVLGHAGAERILLPDISVRIDTPFAVVAVTSLDSQPISSSRHLLVTAVARCENTGTLYNAIRTVLRSSGGPPSLLEPVEGEIEIRTKSGQDPQVFVLAANGERERLVETDAGGRGIRLALTGHFLYEIEWGKN